MNLFGIHFCADEFRAIVDSLMIVSPFWNWLRTSYWSMRHWAAARRAAKASDYYSLRKGR